ncbi:MAG: MFS transporter, partial [Acidimicrobiia bacterium]
FGVLTADIALGNLIGGRLLRFLPLRAVALSSLAVTAAGCAVASQSTAFSQLIGAQILIGLGVGLFFAPGLKATGLAAGSRRRGLAMGIFGVAFSAGLAAAAFLASQVAETDWRSAFMVAAWACIGGFLVLAFVKLPDSPEPPPSRRGFAPMRLPVLVGTVGTVSQYGTVGFLALFAVSSWGFSPAEAAVLLAVGRVLSAPGKIAVGTIADRFGSRAALRSVALLLLLSGLGWSWVPASPLATGAAVLFVATVSALFPIANLLAFERFGTQGGMLGTYRSAQIALGSLAAFLIGALAEGYGLRPVLIVSVFTPLALLGRSSAPGQDG